MLTTADKEEIKRMIEEMFTSSSLSSTEGRKDVDQKDEFVSLLSLAVQARDLIVNQGFTDLTFVNPKTGERTVVEFKVGADSIVDVTARAIEVFGTRERALRWLKTPVPSLGDQTPLSLLNSPEGVALVQDTLGRVEHGVW